MHRHILYHLGPALEHSTTSSKTLEHSQKVLKYSSYWKISEGTKTFY